MKQLALYILLALSSSVGMSTGQNSIQFTQDTYSVSVNETTSSTPRPMTGFVTVTCVHTFNNSTTNITYELTAINGTFRINAETGDLMATMDLDYETVTSYELGVQCISSLNGSLSDEALINITVLPVNEFRPQLSTTTESVIIDELTPPGTVIISTAPGGLIMYSASDRDRGPDENIYYSLFTSTNNESFAFNSTFGALVLVQPIDLDSSRVLVIREDVLITVCDVTPPAPDCLNIDVSIILLPANDNAPRFVQSSLNVSYSESVNLGTVIGQVTCLDDDFAIGALAGYEIVSVVPSLTPAGTFVVNNTGAVAINRPLDFEFTVTYQLELRCYDSGLPPLEDFATVRVDISDYNDNAPNIEGATPELIMFNDNSSINLTVFVMQCSDLDSGPNAEVLYSIANTTAPSLFEINQLNGIVTIVNPLTLPVGVFSAQYSLVLECADGGEPMLSNQTELNIYVYKNDNTPPSISSSSIFSGVTSIPENVSLGDNVLTVRGIDETSPSLAYSLSNESSPGVFVINSTTGVISLNQELDREVLDIYTLQITVTEERLAPGTPATASEDLTIQIGDVNDNSPECVQVPSQSLRIGTYSETHNIVIFNCSDRDTGINKELRYTFSEAPMLRDGEFVLNRRTGELSFQGTVNEIASYTILITISDMGFPPLSTQLSLVVSTEGTAIPATVLPLWLIIVLIVIGLLLICLIIMFMICCCYCCMKRRYEKRQKHLLSGNVAKYNENEGVVISQYPSDGGSSEPESDKNKDFHLTFETTSFSSTPTTPTSKASGDEGFVYTTSTEVIHNPGVNNLNPPSSNQSPPEITITVDPPDVGLRTPGMDHSKDVLIAKNEGADEEITGM